MSDSLSPAKMARIALALAHSHCHLCSTPSELDCRALTHCLTQEVEDKITRAYLSVNPQEQQGENYKYYSFLTYKSTLLLALMGVELDKVLLEVQSTRDELEMAGTSLDKRLNGCSEELRCTEMEVEGDRTDNSTSDQLCGELQSTKSELREARDHLDGKIDLCFIQIDKYQAEVN